MWLTAGSGLLLTLVSLGANATTQLADIGFHGADAYIAVELVDASGEEAYRFALASRVDAGRAVPISDCVYTRAALAAEVSRVANPAVAREFSWIFVRSGYAGSAVEEFYPEFKSLLERANPACQPADLTSLRANLGTRRG